MTYALGFRPGSMRKPVFPSIFPLTREARKVFGLEGAPAQFVVGVAVAGQPAR
jgi:hypothetical protein